MSQAIGQPLLRWRSWSFIGASGALLLLGLQGGSHTAVAWRCRSPPRPLRPWTRSITNKGGRGGRQAADRAVLPAERAVSEVEPLMTYSLEGCAVHLLYHQSGRSWQSCRRRHNFIDSFITKTATGVLASPRGRGRGHVRLAVLPWPQRFPSGAGRPEGRFLRDSPEASCLLGRVP